MTTVNGALLAQAQKAIDSGQKEHARQLLQQAARQDPADYRPWLYLAGIATSPVASRAFLDRAAALNPGDPTIDRARAWVERRLVEAEAPPETNAQRLNLPPRDLSWTLLSIILLVLLVAFAEWLPILAPLRLVLGILFVLFVPGYWLTAALFPSRQDIDGIERLGLSLGLSVAWVPVLALVLDWLPWHVLGAERSGGLRLWPILIGQLLSILLFMAVTLWRRSRLSAGEAFLPAPFRPRAWWQIQPPADRRVYILVTGVLFLALFAAAWVFLVPSPDEFMTEFYMLGPEGLAENFPRQAAPGEPLTVTLGITNRERDEHTYRVEVWAVDPFNEEGRKLVTETPPLTLPPDETLEWPLTWHMPEVYPRSAATGDQQVKFLLFIDGQTDPYRRLLLWLNVAE